MASGETLLFFGPLAAELPASNYATFDTRNNHPCLDYDATTDEEAYFTGVMLRNYGGGGVTIKLIWSASSATSGNVVWETAFERIGAAQQNIDSDGFATGNTATGAANGSSGNTTETEIAHTNGAQMDSVAAGELFRLRVRRLAADGSDTMTGDAELLGVEIRET